MPGPPHPTLSPRERECAATRPNEFRMTRFIVPLSDRVAIDPDHVGPKAANLAKLAHAGLPTPGGFCISADAYWRQVQHLELGEAHSRLSHRRSANTTPLVGRDQAETLSKRSRADLLAQILTAWWEEPKPAAVRSSALIEDRADTNFAGQFESFLGVADDTEFLTALRACWAASGLPTRAVTWRNTISIRQTPLWQCWYSRWSPRALPAAV